MKLIYLTIILVSSVIATILAFSSISRGFKYPKARRDKTVVDDLHGVKVPDPYRWFENPNSKETNKFIKEQNRLTEPFLKSGNQWRTINEKLTNLLNYTKYTVPYRHGKYYFTHLNSGLEDQNILYKQESLNGEPTILLDPNTLSKDGTVAIHDEVFSRDGQFLAYGITESGSDWVKIKVRNVETADDYPDLLERVKFSMISWTHDNKGFFYCRFPENDGELLINHKMYYHRVGEPQEKDILVFEFPENPKWGMSAQVSVCGKYLIMSVVNVCCYNGLYFADLEKNGEITGKIALTPIAEAFEAEYQYVTNTGSKVVFRTNRHAPNYRLITIDLDNYAEENWTTLVPEAKKDVLLRAHCVHTDKLIIEYLHDVKSILQVHSLDDGKLIKSLPLEIGQITTFSGHKNYSEIFYNFVSFLTPGTIYRYDLATLDVDPTIIHESKLNFNGFDKNKYIVDQKFFSSRDGTKVPMFIVQRKNDKNVPKPCILHGYGGFNDPLRPHFREIFLYFIEAFDGVVAFANIRGGGEYGDEWHKQGILFHKQNSYDDFQAAAEYLIEHQYTEHKKISIYGHSNGGLLIGVSINQRSDLFGAAIAQVGVMDLLRFHKYTIGHYWRSEYGNPDVKLDFENLYKFSPLHNIHSPNSTNNQYPATFITTADHDDRVCAFHSLKFAAALQYSIRNNPYQLNPILLKVYNNAGHGLGKPIAKEIEEATDMLTFLYKTLGIKSKILNS